MPYNYLGYIMNDETIERLTTAIYKLATVIEGSAPAIGAKTQDGQEGQEEAARQDEAVAGEVKRGRGRPPKAVAPAPALAPALAPAPVAAPVFAAAAAAPAVPVPAEPDSVLGEHPKEGIYSRSEINAALMKVRELFGIAEAKQIIYAAGVEKMTDIPEGLFDFVFAHCEAKMKEKTAAAAEDDGL
jgi:hypothetical protein